MQTYLALLRGVNVGGKGLIKMAELQSALAASGLANVRTYIQSGNVFFESAEKDVDVLSAQIADSIAKRFGLQVGVAVFSKSEWQRIIADAPTWWGRDETWKHNLLILLRPYNMADVVRAVGQLKPDIEAMQPGEGVLYQSMSRQLFGRTTTGKLAASPVYKTMTVRNYNTATKLLALFD